MPSGAASKHTKKSPDDEEQVRKKKTKSSSDKHRRRASSHSSSSDDDDDTRARTKASKRDSKKRRRRRSPSRERKKTKKPDKKKPRKPRRRSPSVSSDSGSCSTCRGSSSTGGSELARSRSPGDRYKTKARGRGRDRDRSRKTRYRSPSCSTCSEDSSRSRSRSRGRKHRAGRPESKALDKKERRYGSRDEGRDKIIRAYDDFRPSRSNDGYVSARKQDSGITASDKKAKEGASSKADIKNHKKYEDDGYDSREISAEPTKPTRKRDYDSREISAEPTKSTKKRAEAASSKISTQPANKAYDDGYDPRRLEYDTAKDLSARKHSEVVVGSGSHASEHAEVSVTDLAKSEAQDLELILRQRALENFKKFHAGIASKTISLGDQKDKVGNPSHENVRDSTNSTEGEDRPIGVRLKSIASVVISNPNDNVSSELVGDHMVISSKDDQKTQHQVKRVREPRNKASLEQSGLTKDVQDRRDVSGPGSSNPHEPEVNRAGGSASGTSFLKTETATDKTTAEGGGGDQFEQKTFSTMHAGEMVQVSYKVYIPKKVPALARRQLRR